MKQQSKYSMKDMEILLFLGRQYHVIPCHMYPSGDPNVVFSAPFIPFENQCLKAFVL